MAGFGTILSQAIHDAYPDRILNTHPALLPAFKGWHAVEDALAYGVKVTGWTVHMATLEVDAGPILAQEAGAVLPGDTKESLHERIKEVERRRYPEVIREFMDGSREGTALRLGQDRSRGAWPAAWPALGWELVSSGGTSRALAEWGIDHTSVEEVTGSPEMLDGRVKTLHPKIHGGILADRSKPEHQADLDANGITAIDLVVCNLYPFRSEPGVEMIDIGGPTMVRAAAKNHAARRRRRRPGRLRRGARRAAARRRTVVGAPGRAWPAPPSPTPRPTTRPSSAGSTVTRRCRPRSTSPSSGRRSCGTARTRTSAAPATARSGTSSWWDGVTQHGGMALSYLNLYDAEAAWQLVHDLGDRSRPSPSSSTPTRAASPSPTTSPRRTSWPTSATTSRPSAASSPSTGR